MGDYQAFNQALLAEFRANGGKVGGQFAGRPLLLLSTTGARSGQTRTSPLGRTRESRLRLPRRALRVLARAARRRASPGAFGENLTTTGLDEATLQIGDRLLVGGAELVVTQPRLPCFKLNLRFNRPDMVRRFLASRRTGFYFAVVKEGLVAAGDALTILARDPAGVSVADIMRVYAFDKDDRATMRRIVAAPALAEGWRTYFAERLAAAEAA